MISAIINNKSVLKNFISILSVDTLIKASGILLLPVYLKLMLPEEYGLYTYIVGLFSFLASVGSMGIYGVLNRYFYDEAFTKEEVVSTLGILLLFTITLSMFIALATSAWWAEYIFASKPSPLILIVGIFASLHSVLVQFLMAFFYINKSYKEIQLFNISRLVFINLISICVLYFSNTDAILGRLSALVFSELLVLVFFIKYLNKSFSMTCFNRKLAVLSLKFGYPLTLSAILGFIYTFADKYFIQDSFGFAGVGEYAFTFMIASLFTIIFSAIQNFWIPFFFSPENAVHRERRLIQLILILFIINLLYYFIVTILLKIMFNLNIFNSSYENGLHYLWLLVLAQLFNSIQSLYNNYYALYNKTLNGLYVGLIMSVVSLFVMYTLITNYGVYGVATAVLVNSILSLILTMFLVARLKRTFSEKPC